MEIEKVPTPMSVSLEERRTTRKYRETTVEKSILDQIIAHDLSKTAIFSGAGVDPDGLASAEVMRRIVETNGGEATVFYCGSFNRPQNKTMRQSLNLVLKSHEDFEVQDYTCYISVDGPAQVCPTTPHFIIDHHEQNEAALIASDIRQIGSCSAIMWKYAVEAGINFNTEDGALLATALAIGIMTDTETGGVETASDLDFEALADCLKHKDNKTYKEILNFPEPAYYNDYQSIGWANRVEEQAVLITSLGDIPSGRSGVISHLAEKYHRTDGYSTAVVFAMIDGNIMASMRTSNSSLSADEFMKTVFGAGGGKKGAGAAIVQLPDLFKDLPDKIRVQMAEAIGSAITHKALKIAGDGYRQESEQ
jgi:nanoRNase/pAp phosphatase (c-di-AMP/oligoRNAs hydrolase)